MTNRKNGSGPRVPRFEIYRRVANFYATCCMPVQSTPSRSGAALGIFFPPLQYPTQARGPLPVSVFGQGANYGSPVYYSVLSASLGSPGYFDATSLFLGSPLPKSPHALSGLEAEVRDMEYLISYMRPLPN